MRQKLEPNNRITGYLFINVKKGKTEKPGILSAKTEKPISNVTKTECPPPPPPPQKQNLSFYTKKN